MAFGWMTLNTSKIKNVFFFIYSHSSYFFLLFRWGNEAKTVSNAVQVAGILKNNILNK